MKETVWITKYGLLTKYHGSLNNACEQIFARDSTEETEEVYCSIIVTQTHLLLLLLLLLRGACLGGQKLGDDGMLSSIGGGVETWCCRCFC